MPEIMIAVRPGVVYLNGQRRMVRKGKTTAHAGHPIVTDHPKLWRPITVDFAEDGDDLSDAEVTPDAGDPIDNHAVREWAAEQGIEVKRGKIPQAVIDKYRAATADGA